MPSNDPTSPTAGPGDPEDAVRRLQERLDQAAANAERLIAEAAAGRKPPPAGWEMSRARPSRSSSCLWLRSQLPANSN